MVCWQLNNVELISHWWRFRKDITTEKKLRLVFSKLSEMWYSISESLSDLSFLAYTHSARDHAFSSREVPSLVYCTYIVYNRSLYPLKPHLSNQLARIWPYIATCQVRFGAGPSEETFELAIGDPAECSCTWLEFASEIYITRVTAICLWEHPLPRFPVTGNSLR